MTTSTSTSTPTVESLQRLAPLGEFEGFGGITLRVSQRTWQAGTPIEAVRDGSAIPSQIVATQDGRAVGVAWHEGPTSDEVYFERYEVRDGALVMVSHGWVDKASRAIAQIG